MSLNEWMWRDSCFPQHSLSPKQMGLQAYPEYWQEKCYLVISSSLIQLGGIRTAKQKRCWKKIHCHHVRGRSRSLDSNMVKVSVFTYGEVWGKDICIKTFPSLNRKQQISVLSLIRAEWGGILSRVCHREERKGAVPQMYLLC